MSDDVGAANARAASARSSTSWPRSGVRHVCVCPGSRSTPLALALARRSPTSSVWMHLDERSAALLRARAGARAAASRSALLAHLGHGGGELPARRRRGALARVPLVVLTADRPHELRDVGAPQTIDQMRLYGGARQVVLRPARARAGARARAAGTRARRRARGGDRAAEPAGPVHLNLPFREPLMPRAWRARAADGPARDDVRADAAGRARAPPGRRRRRCAARRR